ncbi:YfbM family protein [Streptomyces sp. HUAS TT20]|uniref:YfbM family protein n=1 Tax=Streptomyces sp. HUAS TT20 TaxID=3447509 RepID=UPI0021DA86B6|nr:YfbM family protein [Streptomyces sp. HUAS 15-9]UXY32891.1 YfbM family protein [Streptomyces sp. HUAS 15-9]
MSIHLHLRAVAESEIRDDHTWLAAFMSEAWDNHPDEYAAGIADSINKVWGTVNDLYAAADVLDTDADEPWTLPIYGGRPVPHSADADPSNPPLMLLEPPGVSQAAAFLATVSFDQLWNVAGGKIMGPGRDEAQARQEFLNYHRDLLGFYERAASAGHAVVKAVWA